MKKSKIWILSGVAIAVLVVGGARLLSQRKAASAPATTTSASPVMELASTDVLTVKTQALALGLPVSGALKATQSAFIKARVAGELVALNVREGDAVQAGQVVARVDPTEYQARQRQAQQQADSAKAQVDIAQRQYDNNKALVDQGFIAKTALDNSQASYQGAVATHQAAIAGADFITIGGMGHYLPDGVMPVLLDLIGGHARRSIASTPTVQEQEQTA